MLCSVSSICPSRPTLRFSLPHFEPWEADLYGPHQKLWLSLANRGYQQEIKERQKQETWYWFLWLSPSGLAMSLFWELWPFQKTHSPQLSLSLGSLLDPCRPWGGVVCWVVACQRMHPNPWICKCNIIWKKVSVDIIKLRNLRWGDNFGLSEWVLPPMTSAFIRERQRESWQTEEKDAMWPWKQNWSDMATS